MLIKCNRYWSIQIWDNFKSILEKHKRGNYSVLKLDLSFFKPLLQGLSEQWKTNSAGPDGHCYAVISPHVWAGGIHLSERVWQHTSSFDLTLKHQPQHTDRITIKTLAAIHDSSLWTYYCCALHKLDNIPAFTGEPETTKRLHKSLWILFNPC